MNGAWEIPQNCDSLLYYDGNHGIPNAISKLQGDLQICFMLDDFFIVQRCSIHLFGAQDGARKIISPSAGLGEPKYLDTGSVVPQFGIAKLNSK
jgi:hypothetical protein